VVDKTKVTGRWYGNPQNDHDEKVVRLKDVPEIFLHEMLAAVEAIKPVE
jgi:predicted DNA-binding protein (MmcQ/YjbR family)